MISSSRGLPQLSIFLMFQNITKMDVSYKQPTRREDKERRIALPCSYLCPTMILNIYVRNSSLFIYFLQFRNKISSTLILLSAPCLVSNASKILKTRKLNGANFYPPYMYNGLKLKTEGNI